MINKIKKLLLENRTLHQENSNLLKELEWAHVYHDSIRGQKFLEKLPLYIGRWAGNYSFFYILNRILLEYKPKSILEFGLGESSKLVSTYLDNILLESSHKVIEQDEEWKQYFLNRFKLSDRSQVLVCPLYQKEINGFLVNHYSNLMNCISKSYDLYIIDGPLGSERYSRYDIISIAKTFSKTDEFIILFDDSNREGEKETLIELIKVLRQKDIFVERADYSGTKTVTVIATKKYSFATSF